MTGESEDEFVQFLLTHAGKNLRSVVEYGPDGSELLYLRDDAGEAYSAQKLEGLINQYRRENDESERIEHLHVDRGVLDCVVRSFDDGVEMHFLVGDGRGMVVGLDPDAATNLHGFVDECFEHLDGDR